MRLARANQEQIPRNATANLIKLQRLNGAYRDDVDDEKKRKRVVDAANTLSIAMRSAAEKHADRVHLLPAPNYGFAMANSPRKGGAGGSHASGGGSRMESLMEMQVDALRTLCDLVANAV